MFLSEISTKAPIKLSIAATSKRQTNCSAWSRDGKAGSATCLSEKLLIGLSMPPSDPEKTSNTRLCQSFLGILGLGIFLRVYNFWVPDLWVDEYGTWWVVSASTWTEVAKRATDIQGQSPLYYLIVKLFTRMLGEGPWQLRLPSVIFGILTLLVALRLAVRIFHDNNLALVSTAIFSVTEQLIWFSQSARPYALALLLMLCSFLLFLDSIRSQRMVPRVGYALMTALLIYSHFLFGIVIAVQAAIIMIKFGWRELLSKYRLLTLFLIVALCLPLSGQIVSLYLRRQTLDWVPNVDQAAQASQMVRGLADPWALVLATITLLTIGLRPIDLRNPPAQEILPLLFAWLLIPLAEIWVVMTLFGVSLFAARYILMIYPAAYYLWAWLLLHGKPVGSLRWLPSGVFVLSTLLLTAIPNFIETKAFRPSEMLGWAEAATTLANNAQAGDLVVFYPGFIEADLFVQQPQNANLLSFVSWPLVAHLPANQGFNLLSLPLQQNDRTDAYIQSVELQAAKRNRVWVVAPDKQRIYFNAAMMQHGFYSADNYGHKKKIGVSLLVRASNGS